MTEKPPGDERAGGLVLALDAGSPVVSVAVGRGGAVLATRAVALQRSSTQLLALVAETLAAAGARPADLDGVVALAGPGSFTGLRVGLATALGLHQGLGVRAQALPTLAALAAASAAPPGSLVIAAVDALRGDWAAQAFQVGGPLPVPLGEMALVPAAELPRRLAPTAGAEPRVADLSAVRETPDIPAFRETPAMQANPEMQEAPEIIAFGAAALCRAIAAAGGRARCREAPPLAPAALRLAAALPPASWRAASLTAPIYSRPPATTSPRPRIAPAAPTAGEASAVPAPDAAAQTATAAPPGGPGS
ncbi:MAG TPA: tRNA (adenosine(37)-N6)-threonylcarbamoyltransferase complex dimerization subunit type 1 TsaB [Thermoanaerobaculia bacterium]|jgi:tRNA threonylcarbamoyladenosine biosynthesis protein TsaB|nr:tRNA (adenosine(37)-N6)-threonylcarbamoyltransferase complex dimerization subunit type 1 TsaB [Thermoanaerobaculia bacterium]